MRKIKLSKRGAEWGMAQIVSLIVGIIFLLLVANQFVWKFDFKNWITNMLPSFEKTEKGEIEGEIVGSDEFTDASVLKDWPVVDLSDARYEKMTVLSKVCAVLGFSGIVNQIAGTGAGASVAATELVIKDGAKVLSSGVQTGRTIKTVGGISNLVVDSAGKVVGRVSTNGRIIQVSAEIASKLPKGAIAEETQLGSKFLVGTIDDAAEIAIKSSGKVIGKFGEASAKGVTLASTKTGGMAAIKTASIASKGLGAIAVVTTFASAACDIGAWIYASGEAKEAVDQLEQSAIAADDSVASLMKTAKERLDYLDSFSQNKLDSPSDCEGLLELYSALDSSLINAHKSYEIVLRTYNDFLTNDERQPIAKIYFWKEASSFSNNEYAALMNHYKTFKVAHIDEINKIITQIQERMISCSEIELFDENSNPFGLEEGQAVA